MCYHFVFTSKSVMHRLLALSMAVLAVGYGLVSFYFYEQERWAREPSSVSPERLRDVRHPEAVLGNLHERFGRQQFGADELALATRALSEAPAFYQSSFLFATYHGSRMESPLTVRRSFEWALERYPANGRLHVAYGAWLLQSRSNLAAWQEPSNPGELRDPMELAERYLKSGMALEPDLSWRALRVLRAFHVPPARWFELTPDDALSQRHLVDVLFEGGHHDEAFVLIAASLDASTDIATLERATLLAERGERAELARDAAAKWLSLSERERGFGSETLEPVLALSRAYHALGDFEASNRTLEDALSRVEHEFGPTSRVTLSYLCALGQEHLKRGQAYSAESFFGQAVSHSPSHVPALTGLARSLRLSGDVHGAIERFEDVLRLEPRNEAVQRELKALILRASRR